MRTDVGLVIHASDSPSRIPARNQVSCFDKLSDARTSRASIGWKSAPWGQWAFALGTLGASLLMGRLSDWPVSRTSFWYDTAPRSRPSSQPDGQGGMFMRCLSSRSGMEVMEGLAVTTSGLYNLSVGEIRAIPVPVPPHVSANTLVAARGGNLAPPPRAGLRRGDSG